MRKKYKIWNLRSFNYFPYIQQYKTCVIVNSWIINNSSKLKNIRYVQEDKMTKK